MLSTWVALSSSQEDTTPAPQSVSITRLAGFATSLLYSGRDFGMAALTTTMIKEQRYLVIDFNYSAKIIFQTYLVSGGRDGVGYLSSTELLEETASAWVLTGELPSPRQGLRGANIDNRVLMTGRD